ncbi:DUF1566 domain-containing protein [Maridesulfovibrio sp.]|uniref:Lcl C-terminal domain-containing protein n=1 Tax=Maridesulfovibrio sp. TaxID=2795000 RepID=UPI0039F0E373
MIKPAYNIISTGLQKCYNSLGEEIHCENSGQDAEYSIGAIAKGNRFDVKNNLVHDLLTGLSWLKQADVFTYPLEWEETLDAVARLNKDEFMGYSDWRLPNRKELRSLVSHGAKKPALPRDHPFQNVFLGWYWTSTTSAVAPAYAWRVHFEGGRMFYGNKKDPSMCWPVRGESYILAQTGQKNCFSATGDKISCESSLQDGALQLGTNWPEPRFTVTPYGVLDELTHLIWSKDADLAGLLDWQEALKSIKALNKNSRLTWRLPNINELESLVDASQAKPALPVGHPFGETNEAYWSSTTSFFEPDWAYALYLHKGAVGVGFKQKAEFYYWPVAGPL